MIAALGRIKRAVREAIGACGGVDGAGMTAGRSRSVAGDWNNLNHSAFPPLDCALALDEVAVTRGDGTPILSALAAELGHVLYKLPEVQAGPSDLSTALIDACAEFGDISDAIRAALADAKVCATDSTRITKQIDEAMQSLVRLRVVVNVLPSGE